MTQFSTFTAPSNWAPYLINGDATGMNDDEQKACDEFVEANGYGWVVDASDEEDFLKYHDAYGFYPYAADCYRYTYQVQQPYVIRLFFDSRKFWNRHLGWREIVYAHHYSEEERNTLRLPIGGEWVKLDEIQS